MLLFNAEMLVCQHDWLKPKPRPTCLSAAETDSWWFM